MNRRTLWSLVLVIVGLLAMLVGAIDPLEGSFVILPGSGVVAIGAFLDKSRYRILLSWAFVLIAAGIGAMVVFTAMGGIGGHSGHSVWWGLFVLPYPLGWIIGLVGAILALIEPFNRRTLRRQETRGIMTTNEPHTKDPTVNRIWFLCVRRSVRLDCVAILHGPERALGFTEFLLQRQLAHRRCYCWLTRATPILALGGGDLVGPNDRLYPVHGYES